MSDYPFRPSVVSSRADLDTPFAKLTFRHATLSLYMNGGEVHATVDGELSVWDLRNLEAMTRGLYPLFAGLQLEYMHKQAVAGEFDPKFSELANLISIPVHHRRVG